MKNLFYPLTPITDFGKLGTGRKKRQIVVVDENGRILFIARVLHNNYRSFKTVEFDNHRIFHTDSQTMEGKSVYLFFRCEKFTDGWAKQCEAHKIEKWMKVEHAHEVHTLIRELRNQIMPRRRNLWGTDSLPMGAGSSARAACEPDVG